jgi:hypothetical protein
VDLSGVAGGLNRLGDELECLLSCLNIWCNATLITNVTSGLSVLLLGKRLQLLVNLSTLAECLGERWCRTCKCQ